MAEHVPDEHDVEQPPDRRAVARALAALVLLALVIVFIVQNSNNVAVHYFTFTGHPRLIWVVIGCLVAGAIGGLLTGRSWRRRTARLRTAGLRSFGRRQR